MKALGAQVHDTAGYVVADAPDGLKGTTVYLGGAMGSTVLGTANAITASVRRLMAIFEVAVSAGSAPVTTEYVADGVSRPR